MEPQAGSASPSAGESEQAVGASLASRQRSYVLRTSGEMNVSTTVTDFDCDDPKRFVDICRREQQRYPMQDVLLHAFKALEPSPDPQHGRKSAIRGAHEGSPPADIGTADVGDPNYDGAPYCSHCGARKARWCTCGPLASNE